MRVIKRNRTLIKTLIGFVTAVNLVVVSLALHAEPAPGFTLPGDNGTISLSDYHGKVVLVDFWASWCGPCRQSFPWMNEMTGKYQSQGFEIIAINLDQEPELAREFLTQFPASFQVAYDPEGKTPEMFKVMGMPTAVLIDRNGKIDSQHIGFHPAKSAQYEADLQAVLKK